MSNAPDDSVDFDGPGYYGFLAAQRLAAIGCDGWFATIGGEHYDVFSLTHHNRVLKGVQRSVAELLVDDHNEAEKRRHAAKESAAEPRQAA